MNLTREYFENHAREISETGSHPEFVKRMVAIREAPEEERIVMATGVTPDELRMAGVPVPETLRTSPRTFERPDGARGNGLQRPGLEPGAEADSAWETYGSMPSESYDTSTWGPESEPLPEAPEDREVIRETLYRGILEIADFVVVDPFLSTLQEMYDMPEEDRPAFVLDVVLNEEAREARGIRVPETMTIQRSTFYDGRPTLFCISKMANLAYPWRKVTITFDNDVGSTSTNDPGNIVPIPTPAK